MKNPEIADKIYLNVVGKGYYRKIHYLYGDNSYSYYSILASTIVSYMNLIKVPYEEFIDMICEL